MLSRCLLKVALLVTLLLANLRHATAENKNFELGGRPGKTCAIVDLKVAIGVGTDYPEWKAFNLTIGGCPVTIRVGSSGEVIQFAFAETDSVSDLNLISVTKTGIQFVGNDATKSLVNCTVSFGDKQPGKYCVPIELSGDVPTGFKLSSETIKMAEKPAEKAGLSAGWIALIVVGCIVTFSIIALSAGWIALIVVGCIVTLSIIAFSIGFLSYRSRKNKEFKDKKIADEQLKTAKSLETVTLAPKTSEIKSKLAEPTSDIKKDPPKEEKEKEGAGSDSNAKKEKPVVSSTNVVQPPEEQKAESPISF